MKFLIKKEECDNCGDCYSTTPKERPLEGAFQEEYVIIEHNAYEPTVQVRSEEHIEHGGKKFIHVSFKEVPNPKMTVWLEEGYDHTFTAPEKSSYPYNAVRTRTTRKIELSGWLLEINTLEELIVLLKKETIRLDLGSEYNLEDKNMPVLILF